MIALQQSAAAGVREKLKGKSQQFVSLSPIGFMHIAADEQEVPAIPDL